MAIDAYMVLTSGTFTVGSAQMNLSVTGESSDAADPSTAGAFQFSNFEWSVEIASDEIDVEAQVESPTKPAGNILPGPDVDLTTTPMPPSLAKLRKMTMNQFKITKPVDYASPTLFLACLSKGGEFATGTVVFRKSYISTPIKYLVLTFTNVRVDKIDWRLAPLEGSDSLPEEEEVSFSFEGCSISYTPQLASGMPDSPVTMSWDVSYYVTNTGS